MSPPPFPHGVPITDPRHHDTARADAWLRATRKLQQLGQNRPFLADLVALGIERVLDQFLDTEE
jgi:hypothetical protein